jgi:transcriptional regulator with XRE-family HTH domain
MSGQVVKRVAANTRALREDAGMSLSELARRAGLSKGALSQIEAAQANPTVETLWSLAQALGVPFSELIVEPRPPAVHVTHSDDEEWIVGNPVSSRLVQRLATGGMLEIHQIRVTKGSPRRSDAHAKGLTELVVVQSGRMRVGPVDTPVELAPGDSATYAADKPHLYEALEPGTTGLIVMSYPARKA